MKLTMPKMLNKLILIAVCSILLSACNLPTSPDEGKLLYHDDFSDPTSGFPRYRGEGISDYEEGTYRILIEYQDYFSWGITHGSYGDVRIEVDLGFAGGGEVGEMGLVCRWQDELNFYLLTIRSDGQYSIMKKVNGIEEFIGIDSNQESSAINQGVNTNHLRADCIGDQLSLYANNQHLVTVNDLSFQFGDVGFIAGSFDQPNIDVFFDNFYVYQP